MDTCCQEGSTGGGRQEGSSVSGWGVILSHHVDHAMGTGGGHGDPVVDGQDPGRITSNTTGPWDSWSLASPVLGQGRMDGRPVTPHR